MKRLLLAGFCTIAFAAAAHAAGFTPPPESAIPQGPFGDSVRRGEAIFTDTQKNAHGFTGNVLTCENCHLDRGRKADSAPMWAAWVIYPQFRSKNGKINSMAMRIQGCFQFSINGKAPPLDSALLTDLQSYFFWLATGAPTGKKMPGQGFPELPKAAKTPDAHRGALAYQAHCALCHGDKGEGRVSQGKMVFPPLWGAQSYNKGAGMYRVNTAAAFIRANMPYSQGGSLDAQTAWDLAAYINSQPRPADPRKAKK